ncbi:peptidylprolyl isomerase [Scytonema hofmannii PCC 7110]|uniref:peptidylprolyl isomerase n=1 Tax=Scytonema hofmannii PCC 7110 TaxID=128403 RepID=A0A139WZ06_9CYAN|nr:peptidylprolyl isomerase [Scytonema hofmannii]KYC37681.1 peptidylprolyl isomerase [Scytonema hofmannii PCC 7110]
MDDFSKIAIAAEEVVSFLKSKTNYKEVYQNILFQRVVERASRERGIAVTTEEIEAEAERQRREKRLEKASDTLAWLADELISFDDWEVGIRNQLLAQKLAVALFSEEVEKFFWQNSLGFEQVILYQLIVSNEKLAQELYYQIEEGEISFYYAAHLYDIDDSRRRRCGYEGKIERGVIPTDIAAIVFSKPTQELIGPLKTEQGYHLLMVEGLLPAELTTQKYEEILNNMFQQWLLAAVNTLVSSSQISPVRD